MNVGISALKIIACFCIIIMHCGIPAHTVAAAVPLFMFLSMFLTSERLETDGNAYLSKRIKRIAIPYFAWGIIAAIPFSIFYRLFEFDKFIYQMMLGSPYDPPLYFLTLLMIYTVITAVAVRFRYSLRIFILSLCLVACFGVQYTGINYIFVESTFPWIPFFPRCTLGRFVELLPSAILGIVLGSRTIKSQLLTINKTCLLAIATAMVSIMLLVQFTITYQPKGYGYQGFELTAIAVCAGILAYRAGERLGASDKFNLVNKVANLTIGIYVIHVLVANALSILAPTLSKGLLLVFIVCAISVCSTMVLCKLRWTSWLVK